MSSVLYAWTPDSIIIGGQSCDYVHFYHGSLVYKEQEGSQMNFKMSADLFLYQGIVCILIYFNDTQQS